MYFNPTTAKQHIATVFTSKTNIATSSFSLIYFYRITNFYENCVLSFLTNHKLITLREVVLTGSLSFPALTGENG